MAKRLYCDTTVFIAALEGEREPADQLEDLFEAAAGRQVSLVTSALSLAETLVRPLEMKNGKLVAAYTILLSNDRKGQVETIDIDRNILLQAAFVRVRKKSVKLPDAIHIATAERAGCAKILTHERRWAGATCVPIVVLDGNTKDGVWAALDD